MISRLRPIIQILRPVNFIITFAVVIVGAIICINTGYSISKIILAGISAGLTASAGNVINDIIDKNADKINHPERPLPSGKISVRLAVIEYLVLVVSAVAISFFINRLALNVVLLTTVLLLIYSTRLKRIPLLGNFTIAFLTGFAFIYGGVAVDNPRAAVIPALFAFFINFIRELVKDLQDIRGDSAAGIKTFPNQFGIVPTKYFITFLTIILIAATVYPFIYKIYNIEFFVVVMIFVNPLLVYVLKSLYDNNEPANLIKLSNLLKLDMVFGLAAIFFGR